MLKTLSYRLFLPLFMGTLAALFTACANPRVATITPLTGELNSGSMLYSENCARCHGNEGEGTEKAPGFVGGHFEDHSDEEYAQTILNGKPFRMPGFDANFSDQEVADVITFVRSFTE